MVSYLTEELVKLGHDVSLFASGDSITSARLVSCAPVALRLDPHVIDTIPYYMLMLDRVRRQAAEFDILHFHIDYLHFPLFRYLAGRSVTTLHGRQALPDIKPIFLGFDDMPLVSISSDKRKPVANANFATTIHHGLPLNLMQPVFQPRGGYLAFVGRISHEERPDRAPDKLVGERSSREGYARRRRVVDHAVGGLGRHYPAVTKGLKRLANFSTQRDVRAHGFGSRSNFCKQLLGHCRI